MSTNHSFLEEVLLLEENAINSQLDPCHEYENSIFIFIIILLSFLGFGIYAFFILTRRVHLSGYDVLYGLLIFFALIRFGPKIWGALEIHGLQSVSQTGCKLIAFTEFGLRHVNTFLLICIVILAHVSFRFDKGLLDSTIKNNFPWILLTCFVVEGTTGMFPAIYSDVTPDYMSCDFLVNESLSLKWFIFSQMFLATILPHILPFIGLIYPLIQLARNLRTIDDPVERNNVRNVLLIVWSHMFLTFPWALHTTVMLPILNGWSVTLDSTIVCIFDGVFRILAEIWYIILSMVLIYGDSQLKKGLCDFTKRTTNSIGRVYGRFR